MEALRNWSQAPAFVLSCPGPLRRHSASLLRLSALSLPQCLFGGEAQLLAFAAAAPDIAERCFFAPLPELFAGPNSLEEAWTNLGEPVHETRHVVHLRFGSTRMARVLKGARNGCVVAERHGAGPLTASHHPFASGLVLPASIRRVFVYGPLETRPSALGGETIGATTLPGGCHDADLATSASPRSLTTAASPRSLKDTASGSPRPAQDHEPGLDVVAFSEFRSGAWAAGQTRSRPANLRGALRDARDGARAVLLPWNMDHPGSIVPELLSRLARLQDPGAPHLRLLVLPFNYLGQTGIIRRLIAQIRDAAAGDGRILDHILLGRLSHPDALRQLAQLSTVAWVDGNDPEHAWTTTRLAACGLTPILLGEPAPDMAEAVPHLPCEEAISIEAETRYGLLTFPARIPSLRSLDALLRLTEACRLDAPPGRRRQAAAKARARNAVLPEPPTPARPKRSRGAAL